MKKVNAMEVQQKRAKRRHHDDDNRQDGNPNVATLTQLFAPPPMSTDTTMQVPPGLPTPGTVHPHVVQDTLATGLLQSLQPTEHGEESQRPALQVPSTLNSATPHDPQLLYAEFIEDEIERSGELISAARTDGRTTTIPTWEELITTPDTTALRSLLSALAFTTDNSHDPWTILGLSRLEGPKPTIKMLQSRRDVAHKQMQEGAAAFTVSAKQELDGLKTTIAKACEDCCAELESVIRERQNLKGTTRNVPRWMEPSEDLLRYLAAQNIMQKRIAMHLSNIKNSDLSDTSSVDSTTCRQLHSHLCGPPEEIERTLARWGDQPLITWAPVDNGQTQKVAAAARKLNYSNERQALLILAVPFDPYPACKQVTDITDVWGHPLLQPKWQDVVVDVNLLIPPTRIITAGSHAPIHTNTSHSSV